MQSSNVVLMKINWPLLLIMLGIIIAGFVGGLIFDQDFKNKIWCAKRTGSFTNAAHQHCLENLFDYR